MKIVQFIQKLVRDEEGVTAIEYGLIAALVAVAIIGGATTLGGALDAQFEAIATYLNL